MTVMVGKFYKKCLQKIWDEFIYGGHFLALGDAIALYAMAVILDIPVTWDFLVVIYLCVFSANLFNRSDESRYDRLTNPVRVRVMDKYTNNFYPIVGVLMIIVIGLILLYSGFAALIFAAFIFIISILYTSLFKKLTKYIVGFKSFIAALFYGLMILLLTIYFKEPITLATTLIFAFYFVRIFISNAACDVKDIKGDKKRDLRTIVVSLGEKSANKFLNILNILSGLIIIYGVYVNVLPTYSLAILLTVAYSSFYFYLDSKIEHKELYTNVIVDGEFILWLPYILIGKLL